MGAEYLNRSEDIEFLEQIRTGDRLAFNSVYTKYWSRLYLYAYNILRDKHSCEDIVQEVLVSLWLKRNTLRIDNLNAFLYTAVRFQVLKTIRNGKVRESLFQEIESISLTTPAEILAEKDINTLLDKHISDLPQKCREIFNMSRKEQLSNKEIAERLGIATKTVENQITIALRRLKAGLGDMLLFILVLFAFIFL